MSNPQISTDWTTSALVRIHLATDHAIVAEIKNFVKAANLVNPKDYHLKIQAILGYRMLTGAGLFDAKTFVESHPNIYDPKTYNVAA